MTVYVEYAFAENFLLDGLLVFLALRCVRAKTRPWRILLSAAIGGAEALLFPLFRLPAWCAVLVKVLGGILLILPAVSRGTFRTYLAAAVSFFAMTFLLGGLLTAASSFSDVTYTDGAGYLIGRAPVAVVLAGAVLFAVAALWAARALYRYRKIRRGLFPCSLTAEGRTVLWRGLADSGNLLSFRGRPVCVISALSALALFRGQSPLGCMTVTTVAGSRDSPVFAAERMEIGGRRYENVLFTVGELNTKEYQIILHTAFTEGSDENARSVEKTAATAHGE